ncbi:MAG: nuclear transport factor 2 family protein [Candidatus Dormibacteraeota bacterium]|nr:nuclear transport factor 2 family protein [Candidatus Dormibacteraeota bacterium]
MPETATDKATANIESLRRGYEAFQTGNLDLLRDEIFHPDIVWHSPGSNPISGDHRGADAVIASFVKQFELTDGTFKVELHDVLGSDDHAVALGRASGQRNGKSMDEPYAHVCHFRDGKLVEAWILDYDPSKTDEFLNS